RVVFDGPPARLFAGENSLSDWGLRRPAAMDLADELRAAGYVIPRDTATVDGLVEALITAGAGRGGTAAGGGST
ncbi:MAG: energy-coupling factor transporter ATPase, partial [Candidatus Eisenbacteria bacterium]|nr:energy-coupling factor transporter ATPase [Candidatus Eisenbacteria bacterium]